jgi:hypothetical protein
MEDRETHRHRSACLDTYGCNSVACCTAGRIVDASYVLTDGWVGSCHMCHDISVHMAACHCTVFGRADQRYLSSKAPPHSVLRYPDKVKLSSLLAPHMTHHSCQHDRRVSCTCARMATSCHMEVHRLQKRNPWSISPLLRDHIVRCVEQHPRICLGM